MIVETGPAPARRTDGAGPDRQLRCLARRGMLHSECQAIDHLRLATGDHLDLTEAAGHETAWVVCRGRASLTGQPGQLTAGDVVVVPVGSRPGLTVLSGPLELLRVAVLTAEAARRLPQRRPVA
ncbi:hypothetical protein [Micromonospora tarensis]|uniref:Cupin domain-containing protein n=1 Tax=Micromonospora tarensis TaxID=2806100 RepID=A0ABS1YFF3_9ACTN|nr:hypothetical protein [Micromonospora tarensis]MBM0276138.1 hypothetical protein [Micromonospora tarensis]